MWMILFSVSQLIAVFACVVLHEYGHSLTARRFGVETVDITLLPIGGVARLTRIPREPIQEFLIAIAGPAVNVAIASMIIIGFITASGLRAFSELVASILGLFPESQTESVAQVAGDPFAEPSWTVFVVSLLVINLMLVVFNMIPAFPMDGGRVLRSVLAMMLPYVSATRWAQRIGIVCAVLMAAAAVLSEPPALVMLLIAAFIAYAGMMETKHVELSARSHRLTVQDVMIGQPPSISMDMSVLQADQWWRGQTYSSVAVVGLGNIFAGVLSMADLARFITSSRQESAESQHTSAITTVGQIANHSIPTIEPETALESVMGGLGKHRQLPVVDENHCLVGWLDGDTVLSRADLFRSRAPEIPELFAAEHKSADYLFVI